MRSSNTGNERLIPAGRCVSRRFAAPRFSHYEYWEDGQQAPVCDLRAGEFFLQDLKRNAANDFSS
jgi:hypothetical protein